MREVARLRHASAKRTHCSEKSSHERLEENVVDQCWWNSVTISLSLVGNWASWEESRSGGGCVIVGWLGGASCVVALRVSDGRVGGGVEGEVAGGGLSGLGGDCEGTSSSGISSRGALRRWTVELIAARVSEGWWFVRGGGVSDGLVGELVVGLLLGLLLSDIPR